MSFSQWLHSVPFISPSGNRPFAPRAGWLSDFSSWLSGIIDSFWTKTADAITAFMEWVADLIRPILTWFSETIASAVTAISEFFGPIVQWFGEQYDAIVQWTSDTIEAVVSWTSSVIDGGYVWITTTATSFATWVGDIVSGGVDWVRTFVVAGFHALWAALSDFMVSGIDKFFKLAVLVISSIEMPDFLQEYSIGSLLGNAGPTIGWLVNALHIPEGMMVIAAGFAFRLLRKVLTLGQW